MILYTDYDERICAWLRELVRQGLLPYGDVVCEDVRRIDVDLARYRHVHLFAGIGGWAYALKLAGWPHEAPIWSASMPCQPFSTAGKRLGEDDERHLAPRFLELVAKFRPPTIVGEQVASPGGRRWFSGIRNALESLGYAVGAADLPACSVGAPHKRQRLFWLAHAVSKDWRFKSKRKQPAIFHRGHLEGLHNPHLGCLHPIPAMDESLADGLPAKVVRLRGYGNAIVPQVGALFAQAVMLALSESGEQKPTKKRGL